MAYESSAPYRAGTERHTSLRIPAVARARSGAAPAFTEDRVSSPADSSDLDTVLKRPTYGSRTGDPLQAAARNGTTGELPPADGRRLPLRHSDDDGATWSPPHDLTDQVEQPDRRWYATGPGHAPRLRHGPYAGNPADTGIEPRYNGVHPRHSDDDATWRTGVVDGDPHPTVAPDETTAAELPYGTVHLNRRSEAAAARHRAGTVPADGGETLLTPFAGLTRFAAARLSRAAGRLDRDTVGLRYGTGDFSAYSTITFRRIPVEEPA
ncbi:sialidase family protein [Streptomyces sp. NPDC048196]|uniref:sialidase family protein n=1 Tax=Streptomyces sp. NPDC048196 TaxID=3154712 RepID=UPI0033D53042